jgi:hypothetical protein
MIEAIKDYNLDFWINDKIVDCGKISNNNVITIDEYELEELELEEKLNKKCEHKQNQHINGSIQYNTTNRRHKNVKDRNIKCVHITCAKNKIDRHKTTNIRMHQEQTSFKHNNIHTTPDSDYNKGHMHTLRTTSRVYDFKSTKRKILLESCPKPKLNIKN